MLRIVFTSEDVARVRLRTKPDPLWELVLSIHMLRGQPGDLLYSRWRQQTAAALGDARLGRGGRLLSDLVPTMGYFPDFLNPSAAADGLHAGLDAIRSTPIAVLDHEVRQVRMPLRSGPDLRMLASGSVAALDSLTRTMEAYYAAAILPYQPILRRAVERESRIRLHAMANGGVRGMLASFRPMMAFSGDELRVSGHPDQVIHLSGRGLTLVPSYFCVRHPVTLFDGALPPVLVYPAARDHRVLLPPSSSRDQALTALIGGTRTAILDSIGSGCTTADLSMRLKISAASASEHARILREAGLLVSHRDGMRVIHQITALGTALLEGDSTPSEP